jgi:hypothetical protein
VRIESAGRKSQRTRRWLASGLVGALTLVALSGCSALELPSGHARLETRIDKLQAKIRELDRRAADQPAKPVAAAGSNG